MAVTAAQLEVRFSSQGASRVKGDIASLGDAVTKSAGHADKLAVGMLAAGSAGLAAFGSMAGASVQFSAGMANVNSIARLSTEEMESLQGAVLDMASEFGAMPNDLTDGLYDIVSSGFEATEALEILEAATVAAGAGLTDTATSTKAITAVLNAYGRGAEDAGDVSDVLFKTVEGGVITFEELAANMGTVLPTAANLGIEIEELGAAYAEMTLQGTKASAAETTIAALMRSALAPTTDMKDALAEYGFASAEALIQTEGLTGYLQFLNQASGGSSESLLGLVGSQEALTAATILSGDAAAGYISQLDGMAAAQQDGAYTLDVFGVQMDTTAGSIKRLQSNLAAAAINMGSAFEPMIQGGVNAANSLIEAFNGLSPAMQGVVAQVGAFGSVTAIAFGGLLLAVPRIAATVTALRALRATMVGMGGIRMGFAGLLGSISPVGAALTALGLAGIYAWNVFREGQDATQGLEDALISLGDVAQSLRLGHRDVEAGFVEDFRRDVESIRGMAEEYAQSSRIMDAAMVESERSATDFHTVLLDMQDGYRLTNDEAERFAAAQVEIGAMFANSQIDAASLSWSLDELMGRYESGAITLDQYVTGVIWATENQDQFRVSAEGATVASQDQAAAMAQQTVDAEALAASMQEVYDRLLAVTGLDDPLSQWNLSGRASEAAALANGIMDASTALDTVFRVVVGNTNAMGQQMQATADWATELINVKGEWGEIDNLLAQGRITLEQYNEAQNAGTRILAHNYIAQEAILAIQAKQAPLIADMTLAQAGYLNVLAKMPAEQSLIALGWMDATTAGRAMEIQQLQIATAMGELGPAGDKAFSSMVKGAAAADPVLKALLLDMGVISEGANGEILVGIVGGEAAMSDLDRLNTTIADLIDILDDNLLNKSYELDIETGQSVTHVDAVTAALDSLGRAYDKLPKTQATPQTGDGTGGATLPPQAEGSYPTITSLPNVGGGLAAPDPEPFRAVAAAATAMTTAINASKAAATSLKSVMSSIGSGVGAGAAGAAGAALGAVGGGGGGGPFAALKTGADQLKTTISGLSTTMTTFNAGPLTLLNAGFPILGATVAAFNAGPLTLLNAGFPILAATMTAFNAGPLTLLNAGFPILAATMTAFNAGPLTLLNAGFPILAATMTAFNAGPLTLLNAGFPILAATMTAFNAGPLTLLNAGFPILSATILAFNAGPLTTLNAAFPILTATMLAFNAGPLTLLNAGFPILGATMAAFNAGPLTTLNAGFPILSATILAFNAGPLTTLNAGFPIVGASATAFGAVLIATGAIVTTFGAMIAASMAMVTAAFVAGMGASTSAVSAGMAAIASVFASGMAASTSAVSSGMAASQGAVSSGMGAIVGAASSGMAGLVGAVTSGMAAASAAVQGGASRWPGTIAGIAGAMAGAGRAAGYAAGAGVASGLSSTLGMVRGAAAQIMATVNSAMRSAARIASPSKMTAEVGAMMGTGVVVGMQGQFGIVRGVAASLAIAGIPGAGVPSQQTAGVGLQMGSGLAQGILGQASTVTGAAVSVVANAIAAAKHAAGIASPAKRMVPVGVHMDAGLAQGIMAGQSSVINASVRVIRNAMAAANAAASSPRSGGLSGLTGVYNAAAKHFGRAIGPNGGAILQGWERLTDGFWRSMQSGIVKKGILAEDNTYVNPSYYNAGLSAGTAFGNGVGAGARSSLQISSPSRVLSELGVYSAQGFMRGVERAYVSPRLDFAPVTPSTPTSARGTQYGANAQGGSPIHITVHVAGNVTAEDDLKLTIVRAVNEGIVEGTRQRNRAMGVV